MTNIKPIVLCGLCAGMVAGIAYFTMRPKSLPPTTPTPAAEAEPAEPEQAKAEPAKPKPAKVAQATREPAIPADAPIPPAVDEQPTAAPPPVPPEPKPLSITAKWLGEQDAQWREAFKQEVTAPYEKGAADLKSQYLAALDAQLADVSRRGELENALALREERKRFTEDGKIPGTDVPNTPAVLIAPRVHYWRSFSVLESSRESMARTVAARYDAIMAKNQLLLTQNQRLDEALEVKAAREQFAAYWLNPLPVPLIAAPAGAVGLKVNRSPMAPTQGLVLNVGFANSQVSDRSLKRNPTSPFKMQPYTDPSRGPVFKFDNLSYIDVPHSPNLTPKVITVAAWVNPSRRTGAIADKGDYENGQRKGYVLRIQGNGNADFTIGSGVAGNNSWIAAFSSTEVPPKEWTHLAGSFDGATIRIYVNGKEDGTARALGPFAPSKYPLRIGGGTFYKDPHFKYDGLVDGVMIFDRALSPAEVDQLFRATISEKGVKFDEAPKDKRAR